MIYMYLYKFFYAHTIENEQIIIKLKNVDILEIKSWKKQREWGGRQWFLSAAACRCVFIVYILIM